MKVNLTPRLKRIADLVPKDARVADIGTDHGYIPLYLLQNKVTSHIIASDVNEGPFKKARENINSYGFENEIDMRLGSGLEVLGMGDADIAIIAGMGGILITELLQKNKLITDSIDTFILQPMQAQKELRQYLLANGFKICQDILIKEGFRIYEILVVQKGDQYISEDIYYEIGFFLKSNPQDLAREFIAGKIRIQEEIIENLKKQNSIKTLEKYDKSKERLEKLQEVLKWLQE